MATDTQRIPMRAALFIPQPSTSKDKLQLYHRKVVGRGTNQKRCLRAGGRDSSFWRMRHVEAAKGCENTTPTSSCLPGSLYSMVNKPQAWSGLPNNIRVYSRSTVPDYH